MLALHPDRVQPDQAAPGYRGDLNSEVLRKMTEEGIHSITPNGILGDPRGMSAVLGEKCIAATVDLLVEHFQAETKTVPG